MVLKDWLDHRPGCLDRIFTCEGASVAGHDVAQEPLVGNGSPGCSSTRYQAPIHDRPKEQSGRDQARSRSHGLNLRKRSQRV